MRRWQVADREFRAEQRERIDQMQKWSAARYDESRQELGIPRLS
jgi:hypothetical protein